MSAHSLATRPIDPPAMHALATPARTVLLVVDVQVDFAAADGAMGRLGLDLAAVEQAIGRLELLLAQARRSAVPIGFARTVTRPETDPPVLRALYERLGAGADAVAICRVGTSGAEFHRLVPEPGDLLVAKTRYSCFAGTELEATLRARGIDTVVVTGLTTDCCVDGTARDAFARDFHVFVVADACADYEEDHHRAALGALGRHCAVVVDSATVIAGWAHGTARADGHDAASPA